MNLCRVQDDQARQRRQAFLTHVVGSDGEKAFAELFKLGKSEGTVLRRASLAWVRSVGFFDGKLPGTDMLLRFERNESGYRGEADVGAGYVFDGVKEQHVAGVVALMLGVDGLPVDNLKKSENVLVSVDVLSANLNKGAVEKPGVAAAPRAPQFSPPSAPVGPSAPGRSSASPASSLNPDKLSTAPRAIPKAQKRNLVSKSMAERPCRHCGRRLVSMRKVNCMCFMDMSASVLIKDLGVAYELDLTKVDMTSARSLMRALRGES